jgi:hypothetical protein
MYKNKYLKYKNKYILLRNQLEMRKIKGGGDDEKYFILNTPTEHADKRCMYLINYLMYKEVFKHFNINSARIVDINSDINDMLQLDNYHMTNIKQIIYSTDSKYTYITNIYESTDIINKTYKFKGDILYKLIKINLYKYNDYTSYILSTIEEHIGQINENSLKNIIEMNLKTDEGDDVDWNKPIDETIDMKSLFIPVISNSASIVPAGAGSAGPMDAESK